MAQLVRSVEEFPLPIRPPSLRIGRELDRGAWGVVHEGEFDGQSVAVKKIHQLLKDSHRGVDALRSFCGECERLRTLDHPHVIKFLGAFRDAELGPILVMEKMKENLRQFLERLRDRVTVQEQIRISLEITQGVAFLHQLNPPMVHRDLNDKNVMFTFDGVAKIGDFGQSKLKQDIYLTSAVPGMVSFMPPECQYEEGNKYDESLDVFSLGVLMLEISTQQPPISNLMGIGVIPEVDRRGNGLRRIDDLHPLKPFILLCLSDDQKKRPKAIELQMVLRLEQNMLQTILAAEQRLHTMEADLQVTEEHLRKKTGEKQSIQMELDHTKESQQQSEQRARKAEAENEKLKREIAKLQKRKQKYKADLQMSNEHLSASDKGKQSLQKELNHAKTEVASRDVSMWQLQESYHQLDATVKETNRQLQLCEKELARKREEAQEYEAQYRLAESKRLEADSYINELTLVAIGMEPNWEAGSADSKEILMKKYHLVKEQNDAWEEILQCTIREFQKIIEALERENMRLQTQLPEAEFGRAKVASALQCQVERRTSVPAYTVTACVGKHRPRSIRAAIKAMPSTEASNKSAAGLGHTEKTTNELRVNVRLQDGESPGSADADTETAVQKALSEQYRRTWGARPEPVGHSKPATQSSSARERSVERAEDIDEKRKVPALRCKRRGMTFSGDQRHLFLKHRRNNCKPPEGVGISYISPATSHLPQPSLNQTI